MLEISYRTLQRPVLNPSGVLICQPFGESRNQPDLWIRALPPSDSPSLSGSVFSTWVLKRLLFKAQGAEGLDFRVEG